MQSVVVTGVSSGIGKGIVAVLIEKGWRVFGSVRKEADGSPLRAEFGDAFVPLVFDVQDNDAILAAAETVRSGLGGETLVGLVNNAGSSFSEPLLLQSVDDFRQQLEINLVGAFAVTRAFAPLLGADPALSGPRGRIVNISSVGGKFSPPFLGAYAASKHGLEGFSGSLRRELLLLGIDVIVIGPGSVKTAIWDKAEADFPQSVIGTIWEKPFRAFQAFMAKGGRSGLEPEDIGAVVAEALTARRPRARYTVAKGKFLNATLPRLFPSRMVDRMIGRQIGLMRK